MGKTKKFINKRNAASFHIVHRPTIEGDQSMNPSISQSSETSEQASKYYLQPSGRSNTKNLPQGFPTDLLLSGPDSVSRADVTTLIAEARVKRQRDRDCMDDSLLPFEYDYSIHLKSISGSGMYVPATSVYDTKTGARLQKYDLDEAGAKIDIRSDRIEEDPLDSEVNLELVKAAERSSRKRHKRTKVAKLPNDVIAALDELDEEMVDELEDDFVLKAMGDESGDEFDDEKNDDDFDEKDFMSSIQESFEEEFDEDEDDDEFDEDDSDEEFDSQDDENDDLYDDGDDQSHPRKTNGKLYSHAAIPDDEFDRLVDEEYGDEEIGALDDAQDEELNGALSLEQFQDTFDEILGRREREVGEGGLTLAISVEDAEAAKRAINQLERAEQEMTGELIDRELDTAFARPEEEDKFDVQSIISTYTNIENHPNLLVDSSRAKRKIKLSSKTGLPIRQREMIEETEADLKARADALEAENKGAPRGRFESAEERKQRKHAAKEAQREARQRKKDMKTAYSSAIQAKRSEITRHTALNPVAAKKL